MLVYPSISDLQLSRGTKETQELGHLLRRSGDGSGAEWIPVLLWIYHRCIRWIDNGILRVVLFVDIYIYVLDMYIGYTTGYTDT